MTVNNVNALLNYTTPQTADQAPLKQGELTQNSFGQVMTKISDKIQSLQMETADITVSAAGAAESGDTAKADGNVQTKTTDKADSADRADKADSTMGDDSAKAEDASGKSDNKTVESTGKKADAGQDEAAEEVAKSAAELVIQIAEQMDVTPEEVEEAMEVLGLMPVELFDMSNLKQLLLTIVGSEDELTIVTDEALYNNMQDLFTAVNETIESLQEELGLSEEELGMLMEQIVAESEEPAVIETMMPEQEIETAGQETETAGQVTEQEPEQRQMPEVNLEGMKDYTVSVHRDGETVQVKVTVDDVSGNKSVREEVTDAPKEEVQISHKMRERDASADSGRGESNAFLPTFDKPVETVETPAPVSAGYQALQTQDIMNQIMDYMRINLKADAQEMELQLHPASLGTVNVQIAAKEGAITAHFTTQNETVRAVIETQLVQLKQQFEEQGIKVDAVEVTVAGHEYGHQFSQENSEANEKQGKSGKSARRINLDEIDEESDLDEMEESERIAVEMMQANGNTVDFTA